MLTELQTAVIEVAERVGPAVVGLGRGWGRGSGVVVAPGQVLTSAHNLRGDQAAVVLSSGERVAATLAASDPDLDLALLQADTGEAPAVEWPEQAGEVTLGVPVVALANPGGRGLRATFGLVSAAGRRFRSPRGRGVEGAIEHTAPLPRGSSGGPLVDAQGRLIGLNSLRLEGGLILAVPVGPAALDRLLDRARGEAAEPRRLGVAVAPPRVARRMRRAVGLPERAGLLVRAVEAGSPAERAGIEQGDLIVAARGRELDGVDGLYAALDEGREQLELTVVRGTEERRVEVSFARESA